MFKIAIIDPVGSKAGMDYYNSSLANGFNIQGVKSLIFSNYQKKDGLNYKVLFDEHNDMNKIKKLLRLLAGYLKAAIECRRQKVDYVILHIFSVGILSFITTLIPKIFGLKIVIVVHDISSFFRKDNATVQDIIYNKLADKIIIHNNFSKKRFLQNFDLHDSEKLIVIQQGGYIDLVNNSITKEDAKIALGLDKNKKYLLFFGQIKKVKGLDILLSAMPQCHQDIQLIIAGKPWKNDYEENKIIIVQNGLENRIIEKIHFISDAERDLLYHAADIIVLPYRLIYQSAVLLMAMSYGLPVVVSDLEPNKEVIIDGENGMFFENGNSDSLAQIINSIVFDESKLAYLSANALKTIKESFSWETISKQYLQALNRSQK